MIVQYKLATGEILMTTTANRPFSEMPEIDETVDAYLSISTEAVIKYDYVDTATLAVTAKDYVTSNLAINSLINSPTTISNLPECVATYPDGSIDNISDGSLTISSDLAGVFQILFTSPIHLDTEVIFTVTE